MRARARTAALLGVGLLCLFAYLKAPTLLLGSQTIHQESLWATQPPRFLHEAATEVQGPTVTKGALGAASGCLSRVLSHLITVSILLRC